MKPLSSQYFEVLRKDFPTKDACLTELINLEAILSLPKGTEHFMSDLHGEYDAFRHILNNCSGVIKEKIDAIFTSWYEEERLELATLVYYPKEKMESLKKEKVLDNTWYHNTLINLVQLASFVSSKYTRSKVKKAINPKYQYIIDELLHTKDNTESNIKQYFENIITSIIRNKASEDYIIELARIIKVLSVDHLHVAGDIYDRGAYPDKIVDLLQTHHSLDFQWGNHDILWFGAARGIPACVLTVLYNNLKYNNYELFENSYGISLRRLMNYSEAIYSSCDNVIRPILKTLLILLLKVEGQIIMRNPSFNLNDRLVLNNIDLDKGVYRFNGKEYELKDKYILNINKNDPYQINDLEQNIIDTLCADFMNSIRLQNHISFLIDNGSVYKTFNNNLIFHGCIPINPDKTFKEVDILGEKFKGREYLKRVDYLIRHIYYEDFTQKESDFMYYLWSGFDSTFTGRVYKTFELLFLSDKEVQKEPRNEYYNLRDDEEVCDMILKEFKLNPKTSHIINGHLPVKTIKGESPILANGKLIIIDGGFCKAYHKTTGIAGYTLIYNSHGLRIKAHNEFTSLDEVIKNNDDIISSSTIIETSKHRLLVRDTDNGKIIEGFVNGLTSLLEYYNKRTF